jgi:TM2 domain-containing membrane protein YozV
MTSETDLRPPPLPKGADEAYCSSCGNLIKLKVEICPHCGVRQRKGADKTALALLAFFMGGIGAHKFYLGKYLQGILYILFCWTGIPAFIAFIEFIIYLCTPGEKIAQKYASKGAGAVIAVVAGFFGFIFFIGILAAIAVPNFIAVRNKETCSQVETGVNQTLYALQEFKANPENTQVPDMDELISATGLQIDTRITVSLSGDANEILIQAAHNTRKCPKGDRYVLSLTDEVVGGWR